MTPAKVPSMPSSMPVSDRYGIVYSEYVWAEDRFKTGKREAFDLIDYLIGRGESPSTIIYNELSELAEGGERVGAEADIVAEAWMVEYLKKNPDVAGEYGIGKVPAPSLAKLRREFSYGKDAYSSNQAVIRRTVSEMGARRWDIRIAGGRPFLVMGVSDCSPPTALPKGVEIRGPNYAMALGGSSGRASSGARAKPAVKTTAKPATARKPATTKKPAAKSKATAAKNTTTAKKTSKASTGKSSKKATASKSILSDLEAARRMVGEEEYANINRFLRYNPGFDISDVYYTEGGWNAYTDWRDAHPANSRESKR